MGRDQDPVRLGDAMTAPVEVDVKPVDYVGLPANLRESMRLYVEQHVRPGDCLTAIMSNDLMGAVLRMPANTLRDLPEIVRWIHWHAPHDCHGSREKVREWIKGKM